MITDDGLFFRAVLVSADGTREVYASHDRFQLLTLIMASLAAGGTVEEIGMVARGPAVENMLAAVSAGAAKLATQEAR